MNFSQWIAELTKALSSQDGYRVAELLSARGSEAQNLLADMRETSVGLLDWAQLRHLIFHQRFSLLKYKGQLRSPWDEIGIAHAQVIQGHHTNKMLEAYTEQATLVKWVRHLLNTLFQQSNLPPRAFQRTFSDLQSWILPAMYQVLQDLRYLAERERRLITQNTSCLLTH